MFTLCKYLFIVMSTIQTRTTTVQNILQSNCSGIGTFVGTYAGLHVRMCTDVFFIF